MDKECLDLRTRLEKEQSRLLSFGQAAGLLDFVAEQGLLSMLIPEKLVLVAVFNQISAKFDEFAELTHRYKQLQPGEETKVQAKAVTVEKLQESYSTLKIKWNKAADKREHMRGTSHLIRYFNISGDIVKDPKKLWWTATDKKKFEALLKDLSEYNDYLHELLHGEYAKRLEDTMRKTYMEMVLVRSQIEDLASLVASAVLPKDHHESNVSANIIAADKRDSQTLQSLARTKIRSVVNDESVKHEDHTKQAHPPSYHDVVKVAKLPYTSLEIFDPPTEDDMPILRQRTGGSYKPDGILLNEVWIEWKAYVPVVDRETDKDIPLPDNTKRVQGLVSLLQSLTLQNSSTSAFRVPQCLGYFDYRDDKAISEHPPLFGIVYRKPSRLSASLNPKTLLSCFEESIPSLTTRVILAQRITGSILQFNTVGWFHKSFRSDAVIFYPSDTNSVDCSEPYITSFEYARPDAKGERSTVSPSSPRTDLYVHPDYQGGRSRRYWRRFDIYSLGIVLLEIAYWKPIIELIQGEFKGPEEQAPSVDDGEENDKENHLPAKAAGDTDSLLTLVDHAVSKPDGKVQQKKDQALSPSVAEAYGVRDKLLDMNKTYLPALRHMMGDRYYAAVLNCIQGLTQQGEDYLDEDKVEGSVSLHQRFIEEVVQNLEQVTV